MKHVWTGKTVHGEKACSRCGCALSQNDLAPRCEEMPGWQEPPPSLLSMPDIEPMTYAEPTAEEMRAARERMALRIRHHFGEAAEREYRCDYIERHERAPAPVIDMAEARKRLRGRKA